MGRREVIRPPLDVAYYKYSNSRHDATEPGLKVLYGEAPTTSGEGPEYGEPLPSPLCGCCRQPVEILRSKGQPYILRGKPHTPTVETVVWKCRCQELLAQVKCILCSRCPRCCRCVIPALEAQ